jgi:hypothetical protein
VERRREVAVREHAGLEPVGDLVHDVRHVGQGEAGGEARRRNPEECEGDRGKPGGIPLHELSSDLG